MVATIEVNKQSVKQLLETGKDKPWVIPEYQRPYAWTDEQVETLFDDLWGFTENHGGADRQGTYFLGSIVSYLNDETNEQEIIDGQQRITSLFLLLRAIYTKLQNLNTKTIEAQNFIQQIESTIWRANKLTGEIDYSNILLKSKVVNNKGNEILKYILETGTTPKEAEDNYSKNYIKFQNLLEQASSSNPILIYHFIYALLNQAILLPITADTQDTALTIFSTLNDRGMPLSDADIFKANIYNNLNDDDKKQFINDWKELDEKATEASESMQQLFYYYMFYLRAKEGDNKSTTPGVRKYFAENKFKRLYEPNLLHNLAVILNLWLVITKKEIIIDEAWSQNKEIIKTLDILTSYPNEFWKYPVIVYYLSHRKEEHFERTFQLFLRKLLAELLTKYLITPTINAVKADIVKLNIEIIKSLMPKFDFKEIDTSQLATKIETPHRTSIRMLLKLLAYNNQDDLLPEKWEIEHIFPQKWQINFFTDISDDIIKEKIEHIGNKLPFEKKLNIVAGNGYFAKKKKEYLKSKISITQSIGNFNNDNWTLDNIIQRDYLLSNSVIQTLKKWNEEYINNDESQTIPTEEEKTLIEHFKAKGWVN